MSAVPIQKFREVVFQILFSLGMAPVERDDLVALLSKELGMSKESVGEAYQRAVLVLNDVAELDQKIATAAQGYDVERISTVEKNILRLGVYELLHDDAIPPKVAIAEAVRLTRKFSSPQAAAFVNAVLDNLYKKSLGQPVDSEVLSQAAEELKLIQDVSNEASLDSQSDKEPEEDS